MSVINAAPLLAAAGGDYQISRSVRLRSSASAYLNRTFTTPTNVLKWTWSGWVKIGGIPTYNPIFAGGTSGSAYAGLWFNNGALVLYSYNGATAYQVQSNAVYRDPSAWYHIQVAFDSTQATAANRIILYVNGVQVTSLLVATYPSLNYSGFINSAIAHYVGQFTPAGVGYFDGYLTEINFIDGQALTASSFGETDAVTGVWKPKKYTGTYGTNGFYLPFTNTATVGGNGFTYSEDFSNAAWAKYQSTITADATTAPNGTTTADKLIETATTGDHQVSRTFSATDNTAYTWSAYAKAAERSNFRMYLQNKAGSYNYADFDLSNGGVGTQSGVTAVMTSVGNGWYRCSVSCNAGTGATASPLAILSYNTGTNGSGTNGLYIWGAQLEGSTSVAGAYYTTTSSGFGTYQIGADQSLATGGYNSWVANNISLTAGVTYDSMLDVPTPYADGGNGRGNYAVLNPLSTGLTISSGNLAASSGAAHRYATATIIPQSGKWYWEYTLGSTCSGSVQMSVGVGKVSSNFSVGTNPTTNGTQLGIYLVSDNGSMDRVVNGSSSGASATTVGSAGSIYQIAFDADNGKMYFGVNNTFYSSTMTTTGNPSSGTNETINGLTGELFAPLLHHYANSSNLNFGQRPFSYTPPTGFKALNTQNLPDSTIKKGNQYFDATAYTGTAATLSIVNGGAFQPDFVWTKRRSPINSHQIFDSIRGVSWALFSDTQGLQASSQGQLSSFNSNGFTLPSNAYVNSSPDPFIAWQWKGGGTAVSNAAGTITSQVSANPTAGFSVVTYTGNSTASATVGHGLGVTPSMIILKKYGNGPNANWPVAHKSIGTNNLVILDGTGAVVAAGTRLNLGNSSTFSVGDAADYNVTNNSTYLYVAYCFSEVAGYSKFGSYTGNGSADGPFVYLGFRPRFVLVKRTDAASSWGLIDTSRDTYNVTTKLLFPNTADAEITSYTPEDILSNGFKLRDSTYNISSGTYIYAAFAEVPFRNALAR